MRGIGPISRRHRTSFEQAGQFLDTVTVGKGLKRLARRTMYEKSAHHGFDALRHLVGSDRAVDFAAELRVNTANATDQDRVALDFLFVAFVDLCREDRKSTRLNSSHVKISYAVFCLK